MGKRTFVIEFEGSATIEIDDQVIDVVDDEWRNALYNLKTPEQIAKHIGYNLIVNHSSLSDLDGWSDQPDSNARIVGGSPDLDSIMVREVKRK